MKNLYPVYIFGSIISVIVALIYAFMSNNITPKIELNVYVVNDDKYKDKTSKENTATWAFLFVALFTAMHYITSIMENKNLASSYVYFLIFLILFTISGILTMYASSKTLTKIPFTENYLYNDNYKSRQSMISSSFIWFGFMSLFSFIYLFSV